jgi:hypothetical protein
MEMEMPISARARKMTAANCAVSATMIAVAFAVSLWADLPSANAQSISEMEAGKVSTSTLSQIESSGYPVLSERELDQTRGAVMFDGSINLHAMGEGQTVLHERFDFQRTLNPGDTFKFSETLEGYNSSSSGSLRIFISPDGSTMSTSSSSSSSSNMGQ